jgi:hypothetical protein
LNEGDTAQFIITTVDLPAGTVVPYTLTGISKEDLVGFVSNSTTSLSANATLNAQGQALVNLQLASDKRTEGTETLTLRLNAIVPGSGLCWTHKAEQKSMLQRWPTKPQKAPKALSFL